MLSTASSATTADADYQPRANPWLSAADASSEAPLPRIEVDVDDDMALSALAGPSQPHDQVPPPPLERCLPRRAAPERARLWWLGVHGGAGESTLASLLPGSRAADHAWPGVGSDPAAVVLVARTSAHGLEQARIAATQWASSWTPPVQLLGLVLVADAPGRLPSPLNDLVKLTRGAVPRAWHVPWIEGLRFGVDPSAARQPRSLRRLVSDVSRLADSLAHEGALHV